VSLFGNEADVAHPKSVYLVAWIIWVWAYAQYIVWFIDVAAWRNFRDAIDTHCRQMLGARAAVEPAPKWAADQAYASISRQLNPDLYQREILFLRKYTPTSSETSRINPRTVNIEVRATMYLPNNRGYIDSGSAVRYEMEIADSDWRRQMVRSTLWILITRRFTLEYFAPFAIGLLPVAIWLYAIP
jgi:hypothetical protein